MRRLADQYASLLTDAGAHPERPVGSLRLLSPEARHEVLTRWNAAEVPFPEDRCIHQQVEAQVERTPEAIALQHGARRLSYREMNTRANQLAHHLLSLGLAPGERVAILTRPCPEAIVAILAVLKAGGAYVPLDIEAPLERIDFSCAMPPSASS